MSTSIYGIASDHEHLERILTHLLSKGFGPSHMSVVYPEEANCHPLGHHQSTKLPDNAVVAGTIAGAGIGSVLGALVGIGSLLIPGVGPFLAAGPILAALSGSIVGAAAGGLTGGFIGLGIPPSEAMRYDESLRSGKYLIAVHAEDSHRAEIAEVVMSAEHAEDIAVSQEPVVQ